MIDIAGPFFLVLFSRGAQPHSIAIHEMVSLAACEAALVQLEPLKPLLGVCIAAQTIDDVKEGS